MTGRLGRYSLWQARDFAFERGLPMVIVSALILFPVLMTVRAVRLSPQGEMAEGMALSVLVQSMPLLSFVIVLIAVNGIVSGDRKRGYYRFLFARPISLLRYYAQSFLISALGVMLVWLLALTVFYAVAFPIFPLGTFHFLALYFLGVGGICFLLSSAFRSDWILLAGLWMMASILRQVFPAGESWYGQILHVVLPPAHVTGELASAFLRGHELPTSDAVWFGGYGAAALLLGLIVLSRRPLAG